MEMLTAQLWTDSLFCFFNHLYFLVFSVVKKAKRFWNCPATSISCRLWLPHFPISRSRNRFASLYRAYSILYICLLAKCFEIVYKLPKALKGGWTQLVNSVHQRKLSHSLPLIRIDGILVIKLFFYSVCRFRWLKLDENETTTTSGFG
jgi:hypothetical protein